jgi:hypothetical protein
MELLAVAKPEVSEWGRLRGRVREGVYPSRWGSGGCAPGKIKKKQMHAGELKRIFQTKSQHTDSCIYTCKLW